MDRLEMVRDYNVIATEINIIKAHTNKILLNSAIEIGKRLKEAKKIVGHGNWEKWLEEEVSYSQRTATNLMRIYDQYSDKILDSQIGNRVADLGYTQALAMLKLDLEDREDFLVEHEVPDMSTQELKEAIKEKQALKEEKEALEAKLKAIENKETSAAKELREKIKEIEDYNALVKEKALEVKDLKEKLQSVQASDVDPMAVDHLQSELEAKKKELEKQKSEIKALNQKLKEKPKEVEVTQIAYEVPESFQKEMDDLKVKLKASEATVEFKATFNVLMNTFNTLLEKLDLIKENQPEDYEKYKTAVNKLLKKLEIVD